jgi:DNA mismatch endonuclease (patch repair protein)
MDNLTKKQRSKNMKNILSKDTKPEKIVKTELSHRKYKFHENVENILGKPDIVFKRKKIAIFIDSDYWHGNPKRFKLPKSNRKYWISKINRNKLRDKFVNKSLKTMGWKVLRIWEYDIYHHSQKVFLKIENILKNE